MCQVILLLLLFFMRKRVALTIALFRVASKVFGFLPLLVLQPFWTFLTLMLFWVYWITVLLLLGTAGPSYVRCYVTPSCLNRTVVQI